MNVDVSQSFKLSKKFIKVFIIATGLNQSPKTLIYKQSEDPKNVKMLFSWPIPRGNCRDSAPQGDRIWQVPKRPSTMGSFTYFSVKAQPLERSRDQSSTISLIWVLQRRKNLAPILFKSSDEDQMANRMMEG